MFVFSTVLLEADTPKVSLLGKENVLAGVPEAIEAKLCAVPLEFASLPSSVTMTTTSFHEPAGHNGAQSATIPAPFEALAGESIVIRHSCGFWDLGYRLVASLPSHQSCDLYPALVTIILAAATSCLVLMLYALTASSIPSIPPSGPPCTPPLVEKYQQQQEDYREFTSDVLVAVIPVGLSHKTRGHQKQQLSGSPAAAAAPCSSAAVAAPAAATQSADPDELAAAGSTASPEQQLDKPLSPEQQQIAFLEVTIRELDQQVQRKNQTIDIERLRHRKQHQQQKTMIKQQQKQLQQAQQQKQEDQAESQQLQKDYAKLQQKVNKLLQKKQKLEEQAKQQEKTIEEQETDLVQLRQELANSKNSRLNLVKALKARRDEISQKETEVDLLCKHAKQLQATQEQLQATQEQLVPLAVIGANTHCCASKLQPRKVCSYKAISSNTLCGTVYQGVAEGGPGEADTLVVFKPVAVADFVGPSGLVDGKGQAMEPVLTHLAGVAKKGYVDFSEAAAAADQGGAGGVLLGLVGSMELVMMPDSPAAAQALQQHLDTWEPEPPTLDLPAYKDWARRRQEEAVLFLQMNTCNKRVLMLVLPYAEGGSLDHYVYKNVPNRARFCCSSIENGGLSVGNFLHVSDGLINELLRLGRAKLWNRDIKLQNLFIYYVRTAEGRVVVKLEFMDYGLAWSSDVVEWARPLLLGDNPVYLGAGTRGYAAPEITADPDAILAGTPLVQQQLLAGADAFAFFRLLQELLLGPLMSQAAFWLPVLQAQNQGNANTWHTASTSCLCVPEFIVRPDGSREYLPARVHQLISEGLSGPGANRVNCLMELREAVTEAIAERSSQAAGGAEAYSNQQEMEVQALLQKRP
jgi:hypothetical protein